MFHETWVLDGHSVDRERIKKFGSSWETSKRLITTVRELLCFLPTLSVNIVNALQFRFRRYWIRYIMFVHLAQLRIAREIIPNCRFITWKAASVRRRLKLTSLCDIKLINKSTICNFTSQSHYARIFARDKYSGNCWNCKMKLATALMMLWQWVYRRGEQKWLRMHYAYQLKTSQRSTLHRVCSRKISLEIR